MTVWKEYVKKHTTSMVQTLQILNVDKVIVIHAQSTRTYSLFLSVKETSPLHTFDSVFLRTQHQTDSFTLCICCTFMFSFFSIHIAFCSILLQTIALRGTQRTEKSFEYKIKSNEIFFQIPLEKVCICN